MGFTSWVDDKTKKFSAWDIALVKIGAMIFGLIIGAYVPFFVRQYLIVFVLLFVLVSALPIYRFFK